MRFVYSSLLDAGANAVSVDGVVPGGPNFSHWPGNRTPPEWKDDLSTGIALKLAALPESERARLFDGADLITNNHFDTDGVLSAFALLEPPRALAHRRLLLDAARTGDFQLFTSPAALAIDLSILVIADPEGPFAGALAGLDEPHRRQRQYELALDLVPRLLADPRTCFDAIAGEFGRVTEDLQRVSSGAVTTKPIREARLVVVQSEAPLHRVALNTAAGPWLRVLSIAPYGSGNLYRYHDRVESWFDLVTIEAPERRRLEPVRDRLDALEAPEAEPRWLCHDVATPIPECWFGEPGSGRTFGPEAPGDLCVSRLRPRIVEHAFAEHFAAPEPLRRRGSS